MLIVSANAKSKISVINVISSALLNIKMVQPLELRRKVAQRKQSADKICNVVPRIDQLGRDFKTLC